MNHDNQEFECDVCHAKALHSHRYGDGEQRVPVGWWSLQCTRNYQSMFVRDICPRCWDLFFVRLFPQTAPPVPVPPRPNPGRDLVIGLTPKS